MPSPMQSEPSVDSLPASLFDIPAEAPTIRPADLKNDRYPNERSSLGKRALLALVRFLIIFCIGVSATLAWQSYGDSARAMIASSYRQLSWLAPQAEPVAQNSPDVIGLASSTASSPDQQQPNAILLDLDAVRQSIDRIASSIASGQEQMTSSADRIAATQEHRAFAAACLRPRAQARIAVCLRPDGQARIAGLAGTYGPLTAGTKAVPRAGAMGILPRAQARGFCREAALRHR